MFNNNSKRLAITMAVSLLLFIGIMGCSKNPMVSEPSEDVTFLTRDIGSAKILGSSAYFDTTLTAEEGGTVSFVDVELYFPPGALGSDTLISIDIPDVSLFANNFGTEGLQFNVPVRVTMNYRDADLSGVNETNIAMAWYNEGTKQWDVIDCKLNIVDKTVMAYVNHFSAYALISD